MRSVVEPSMRVPVQSNLSLAGHEKAHNSAQRGGLSCTITADERHHFAALDFQRDAAQGTNVAVVTMNRLQCQQGLLLLPCPDRLR